MTVVKIRKQEKEAMQKVCAELNYKVEFYTMEKTPELVQVWVYEDDPAFLFYIGKLLGHHVTADTIKWF